MRAHSWVQSLCLPASPHGPKVAAAAPALPSHSSFLGESFSGTPSRLSLRFTWPNVAAAAREAGQGVIWQREMNCHDWCITSGWAQARYGRGWDTAVRTEPAGPATLTIILAQLPILTTPPSALKVNQVTASVRGSLTTSQLVD